MDGNLYLMGVARPNSQTSPGCEQQHTYFHRSSTDPAAARTAQYINSARFSLQSLPNRPTLAYPEHTHIHTRSAHACGAHNFKQNAPPEPQNAAAGKTPRLMPMQGGKKNQVYRKSKRRASGCWMRSK